MRVSSCSKIMPIRKEIAELVELGPMPTSEKVTIGAVSKYETLLDSIQIPVTDDEARELVKVFGEDDFFGLAWTLLHLIETAPSWPIEDCLLDRENDWTNRLRRRAKNARIGTKLVGFDRS